jgi:hypothetical protein
VRAAPRLYGEQFERTLRSDVACALTAMPGPRGLIVLDGIHRLLKADLLGHDAVPVKRLTPVDVARVVLDSV